MTENTTILPTPITRLSPAKINLFLHITGKRADGYHNLQTVFRLLDWGDYLHFVVTNKLIVTAVKNAADIHHLTTLCEQLLTVAGADAITTSIADNLIFKAARTLLAFAIQSNKLPEHLPHVQVTLDKRLPMGAGLGGGSSNAATTLLVLNELWQLNLHCDELMAIGAKIGADVPIFIFGHDAIAMGIGEQLTAVDLPHQQYLLLTPNAHINTKELFAHPKLRRDMEALTTATISQQAAHYIQALNAPYHNVFTPVVESLAPAVTQALAYLRTLETQAVAVARMTGSGSAVFLPVDSRIIDNQDILAEWINHAPCPAYLVNNL